MTEANNVMMDLTMIWLIVIIIQKRLSVTSLVFTIA